MKKGLFLLFASMLFCVIMLGSCSAVCKHEYGEWETIKQSTCYEKGEKTRACLSCGEKETKEIELSEDHELENQVCKKCGRLIYEKFTVTSENLHIIGYTGQETFEIPGTFQDKSGVYYEVVAIGADAFCDISELTSIKLPDSVISIGEDAFADTKMFNTSENWENDILYIGKHLVATKHDISGKHTIKAGTLTIADYAFEGRWNVTEIIMPDSVKYIGEHAFSECHGLEKLSLSNAVVEIDSYAFANCTKIKELLLPDTVTRIGNNAFFGCHNLTEIKIPSGVTKIEYYLMANCGGLKYVTIPSDITNIEEKVFYLCDKLERINYTGTKAQWNAISKNDFWDDSSGSYTVACTDGTIEKGD